VWEKSDSFKMRVSDLLYKCCLKHFSFLAKLSDVLYGCENWSLTLREERRLRVLGRVFGPKRDEVIGEWRKLHNEELNDLYSLPNIVRVVKSRTLRWAGHVARMGEERGVHRVLWGNVRERAVGETQT
jgi:hypothetical protein